MNNTKTTKRALLSSIMAMLICVTMLIGSTFAWFTDSASTAVNKIQAGTLDVALLDATGNSLEGGTLTWQKAAGAESETVLWEPGCTYKLQPVQIKNNGNLALKYKIVISGIAGDAKLNEAIEWSYKDANGNDFAITAEGHLTAGQSTGLITISGHMKEEAGNEYQGLSIDGIGITVVATQDTVEYDSYRYTYDTNATYLNKDAEGNYLIGTADELVYFAKTVNVDGKTYARETVKLTANIDLAGKKWVPVGNLVNYPTITFSGTFDGQGHTISNMNAVDNTVNHAVSGFFGSTAGATIQNVTFKDAVVKSTHYAGVVVAYEGSNSSLTNVNNVVVDGAAITSSAELINGAWDNGDKVGGIVGYATSIAVDDCDVKNSTITGYRDLGGIGGCLEGTYHSSVTNCSVDNVTITIDNTHNYKNFTSIAQHNVGDYIGRNINNAIDTNNTGTATVISLVTVSTAEELSSALNATYSSNTIIKLANDIDLTGIDWPACNLNSSNGATVTFDGNNKTITGLNATNDYVYGYNAYGLIANIGTCNVEIKNLTVSGATVTAPAGGNYLDTAGVIVGYYMPWPGTLTFTNCKVVNCTVNSNMYAAGLVGYIGGGTQPENKVVINNCEVSNCEFNGNDATGALVGLNYHVTTINGATVTGNNINGGAGYSAAALVGTSFVGTTATGVNASSNNFGITNTTGYQVNNATFGYIYKNGQTYSVNGTELN